MHPLLANRTNFLLYLLVWVPIGGFFALMLHVAADLTWIEASSVTLPLAAVYALFCLGPWYACREVPSRPAQVVGMLANSLGGALVAAGIWTVLGRGLVTFLNTYYSG